MGLIKRHINLAAIFASSVFFTSAYAAGPTTISTVVNTTQTTTVDGNIEITNTGQVYVMGGVDGVQRKRWDLYCFF
jgi:hypothetical protein